ncbi:MAG: lambda exonuclease family protein [Bacteroidota bacterium]
MKKNNNYKEIECEQGTARWYEEKAGRFSASEISKLMGAKGLGKTGESYITEKVTELLGVEIDTFVNTAMEYGTDTEPYAREYYEIAQGVKVEQKGFLIPEWCNDAGCSPDGIVDGYGVEFKCPYNPVNHTKNLMLQNQNELKKSHPEYYWQVMMCMAVTGFDMWHFVSFNPLFTGKNRMIILPVKRVDKDIELLKERITEAVKIRNEQLKIIS